MIFCVRVLDLLYILLLIDFRIIPEENGGEYMQGSSTAFDELNGGDLPVPVSIPPEQHASEPITISQPSTSHGLPSAPASIPCPSDGQGPSQYRPAPSTIPSSSSPNQGTHQVAAHKMEGVPVPAVEQAGASSEREQIEDGHQR